MIQVTEFYARSFDLDHMDVFWKISDFQGDVLRYEFFIDRSESPAGPWDQLAGPFQDQYYFRDISPALLHHWRTLYYRLRIRDKVADTTVEYGPTASIPEPDLIAMEINRQEDVLFREFIGRRCWVYPVRTFGAKCLCFDRVSGRKTKSNCLNCYDTGYLGGFLTPMETFLQMDPSNDKNSLTPNGKIQTGPTSARLISFPPVKPDDILIESENYRWKVTSVGFTQRLRSVVHQELVMKEIARGDVEYKLPINVGDLRDLQPSAERNFTNPHHVDGIANLEDIMAVYGYKPRGAQ